MAAIFTTDVITDMEQLKSLSTHVMGVLDRESSIDTMKVLLDPTNIEALNTLYSSIIQNMQDLLIPVAP